MKKICAIFLLFTNVLFAQTNNGISVKIPEDATHSDVVRLATLVRPSQMQINYQQREMLGFIHLGMNTYTEREWGKGNENPEIFNPTELNTDEWIKTFKDAGITAVIFVAKHHDGFCLWPSKYTTHTIAKSPWQNGHGDIVRDVAKSCEKYGVKLCLYLSPWDMHEPTYGTAAYNDFYINQMTELLTNYGNVYLLWFDGAGQDATTSGVDMPFDWQKIFAAVRKIQPNILLSGSAPDVRWIGNEAGKGRETEWCVQGINDTCTLFGGNNIGFRASAKDLGSIEQIKTKRKLVWYPGRGGLPLRKGWFYNAKDDDNIKSLEYLVNSYFSTVGQNANLLLNLSPNKQGKIPKKDAERLISFGNIIAKMKAINYAKGATATPVFGWENAEPTTLTDDDEFSSWNTADGITEAEFEINLEKAETINVIKLQENIRDFGQRVEAFSVYAFVNNSWQQIAQSTTIGFRKMLRLKNPVFAKRFKIKITNARCSISIGNIAMYYIDKISDDEKQIVDNSQLLSNNNWIITTQGIESSNDINKICDGSNETIYDGERNATESEIIFNFATNKNIQAMQYTPNSASHCGHIAEFSIYKSSNGKQWQCLVNNERFDNIENNPVVQTLRLDADNVQFIKIKIQKSTCNKLSISEISFIEKQ